MVIYIKNNLKIDPPKWRVFLSSAYPLRLVLKTNLYFYVLIVFHFMKSFYLSLLIPLFICCEQPKKISEKEVMKTFNEFFQLLDNDVEKIREYLTEDFIIFEVSRKWNTEEFIEFVKGFGKFESKREFKNIKIDTDFNSAHISLEHTGEFLLEKQIPDGSKNLRYEWLESAYLVKENDKLKFKFYFSEQIND